MYVRGHPEVSSFSKQYTEYAGGGGQLPHYAFLNGDYDALHLHTGLLKINIFEVLSREGGKGSQKIVLCVRF